ncbi:MAG: ABC transporter permease [Puia sp.]|nr:ABC transporter permease [Puia sp.]
MFKNYLILAWRNLLKNRVYSFINIFGLSLGIAFALLAGAFAWSELRVNHSLKNADRQYIILSEWKNPDTSPETISLAGLPVALKRLYPRLVADYYRFDGRSSIVSRGNNHFREGLQFGDSTLLKMYGFKLLYGDPANALNDPSSVVLTKEIALKYFGQRDPIGQTITVEGVSGDRRDFMVTGVLDKPERNTIIKLGFNHDNLFFNTAAAKFFRIDFDEAWDNAEMNDLIELQKNVSPKDVEAAMRELLRNNAPEIANDLTPRLVSLTDYNLLANNGLVKKMIVTMSCIAGFILLMAIVNFVNISIGRSSSRMKEMGIRKVIGGLRKQLIGQFLVESNTLVSLATLLAFVIYSVAKSGFGRLLDKEMPAIPDFSPGFFVVSLLFVFLIGSLAGIYPALVLSGLKSVDSLKGNLNAVRDNIWFRRTLVGFQFATAAIVFIGAIIVTQQVNLFFSDRLGYNKNQILYVQLPRDWTANGVLKAEGIRNVLSGVPAVSSISLSFEIPDGSNTYNSPFYRQGSNPSQAILTQGLTVDNQFADTYGIPLQAGVFFGPYDHAGDSDRVVINETASKAMGWARPEDAVGQKIMTAGASLPLTVVGVTADFHYGSMQSHILPLIFNNIYYTESYRYLSIRLKPGDITENLSALQQKWSVLLPGEPFAYHFMDEALERLYSSEIQLKRATYLATGLAIIIVLLGVTGLVSLSIRKRAKEIGIRKILGSSVPGIIALFLKDFLAVVAISGLLASPLAYLIMQKWLNDYACKIPISFGPFGISLGLITIITVLLIILQTIKTAHANPIKSLRSE